MSRDRALDGRARAFLEENTMLLALNRRIEQYEERIKNKTAKDKVHIEHVQNMRAKFDEFLQQAAQVWSDKPGFDYAELDKWKTVAKAYRSFLQFINHEKLLGDDVKITEKDKGLSYDSLIVDARSLAVDFSLLIQEKLQSAAVAQINRLENRDKVSEIGELRVALSRKTEELDALKRDLKESKLVDVQSQVERLSREVARLRPFEKAFNENPQYVELKNEYERSMKVASRQADEISALKAALVEAEKRREIDAKANQVALAAVRQEAQELINGAMDPVNQRIVRERELTEASLKAAQVEMSGSRQVIEELRAQLVALRNENDELKNQLGEGREAYLQEMLLGEQSSIDSFRKAAQVLSKENEKLKSTLSQSREDFDVLSAALNKFLVKAGQPSLPPLARKATAESPAVGAEVGAVKSRHEQAEQATKLVDKALVSFGRSRAKLRVFDVDGAEDMKSSRKRAGSTDSDRSLDTSSDDDGMSPTPRK